MYRMFKKEGAYLKNLFHKIFLSQKHFLHKRVGSLLDLGTTYTCQLLRFNQMKSVTSDQLTCVCHEKTSIFRDIINASTAISVFYILKTKNASEKSNHVYFHPFYLKKKKK